MTIYRGIEKINQELTVEQYDGIARPGEVVTAQIDPSAPDFAAYLADANGNLHPLGGGGNGSPAGNNGQLQFNSLGNFGASPDLTFDGGNGILSATYGNFAGVVAGAVSATGDVGIQGNLIVGGTVLPIANITSDLGSPTSRWRDLYLSNNTIFLGDVELSTNGNALTVSGQTVATTAANGVFTVNSLQVSDAANLGAIANVTILGGNSGQVLTTDGNGTLSWTTVTTSSYGNSNVADYLPTYTGALGGNIMGTQVITAVAAATVADTANSVAGANVSGQVAYAATANSVAGANVTGQVAYANVANSVAASNITGTVNYATYAGTANSVAGANVTGEVANAAHATSADTAGSVAAANITGTINFATFAGTANSVAGANVTGTVATAQTVTDAAQPNITSVGTLAALSVNGNTFLGDANIGNLVVRGTTTTANVSDLDVANATIVIASGANALVANGAGLFVGNDITPVASMFIDTAANLWMFSSGVSAPSANITGTATAAHFAGEAGNLSNITAANITGTINYATYAGTANAVAGANVSGTVANATQATSATSANTAATVTTAAQPNITSVGTLTNLTVSGNSALGNVTGDWKGNVIPTTYGGTGTANTTGSGSVVFSESPDLTGTPTAPTANSGANTTQIATTAFVTGALASTSPIPVNSVMIFVQSAAPTGWTKLSIANDAALRIVSGTGGGLGGTGNFTTVFSVSRTPAGTIANTVISGTVGNTALTSDQMPIHSHTASSSLQKNGANVSGLQWCPDNATQNLGGEDRLDANDPYAHSGAGIVTTIGQSGGGNAHSHSFSGNSHTHTFTGTAMDFAVKYVDGIICIKT